MFCASFRAGIKIETLGVDFNLGALAILGAVKKLNRVVDRIKKRIARAMYKIISIFFR